MWPHPDDYEGNRQDMNECCLYPTYISTVLLRDGSGLILLNPDHIWSSMTHLLKEGYSYKLGFESVVH